MDMNNFCKCCGKCCAAIISKWDVSAILSSSEKYQKAKLDYEAGILTDADVCKDNGLFGIINFTPISKEEAVSHNPHIAEMDTDGSFFYRCRHFSYETRLCDAHENGLKASFCWAYPQNDITFREYVSMPYMQWHVPDCGYAQEWEREKKAILDAEKNGKTLITDDIGFSCKKCGKCCSAIILDEPIINKLRDPELAKLYYKYMTGNLSDELVSENNDLFMVVHLKQISEKEAFTTNPNLKKMGLTGKYYYKCPYIDPMTKLCPLHTKGLKPKFCWDYPVFGGIRWIEDEIRDREARYVPDCGIYEEIERRYNEKKKNGVDN